MRKPEWICGPSGSLNCKRFGRPLELVTLYMNNIDIDPSGQPLSTHLPYAQIAEALFEQGFLPVPLEDESDRADSKPKKPCVKYKKPFQEGLTIRQVREWAKKFPNRNTATIVPNGRVCLDFDAPPPTDVHLPLTPVTVTRRGEHRWHEDQVGCRSTQIIIKGQVYGEVKAAGSIVVMPPSVIKGHEYAWAEALSPSDVDFSPIPTWCEYAKRGEQKPLPKKAKEPRSIHTDQVQEDTYLLVPDASTFASTDSLLAFANHPSVLDKVKTLLGIPPSAQVGGSCFHCVLPSHTEKTPSASLFFNNRGHIVYRDWHARDKREWYSLPEVYASQLHGKSIWFTTDDPKENWGAATHLLWQIRLLIESGALRIPRPALIASYDAPASAQKVADGLSLLFACRWLLHPKQAVPFTWRFAKLWCGIGQETAQEGMNTLFKQKVIKVAGTARISGRETNLYIPTGALSYDPAFANSMRVFES